MATVRSIVAAVLLLSGLSGRAQALRESGITPVPTAASTSTSSEPLRPKQVLLLSAVLPGAGQIHNRKYWKLPLVYGALGGVGYGLYTSQARYKEYATAKRDLLAGKTLPELQGKLVTKEKSSQGVEVGLSHYRTQRDIFIGYMALTYSIIMLDAFVDAHLKEFDINEDLALQVRPATWATASGGGITTGLQLRFRLASSATTPSSL